MEFVNIIPNSTSPYYDIQYFDPYFSTNGRYLFQFFSKKIPAFDSRYSIIKNIFGSIVN